MYPSLQNFAGGAAGPPRAGGAYPAAADGARPPQQQPVADSSPWLADTPSVLRVKIADEYRLDPLVRRW